MNGISGTAEIEEAGEGVSAGGRGTIVLLAVAAAALVLANAWRYAPYVQDDSYISLRYARNLVEGHGLVFNPGERVEGYTNLLYVLFSAVFIRLGLDPILGLKVLGVAAALATLVLVGRLERRVEGGARFSLPLSVLLLAPLEAFVYWTFCPLETALYALLLLTGVLALLARRRPLAVVLFFLLSLTRPEGPFPFAVATLGVFLVEAKAEGMRSALRR
ncbi:MAG TPA: hypothetical protein VGR00_11160, partial [Thermoanaerobaculia bacterium]|nr:hypothetical protein [Thermoanaerobaculia bacterium]